MNSDYKFMSPQQLAKVFTSMPGQALHMFAGMFSDATIVSVAGYMSAKSIAAVCPKLPINDTVRIIPQLDKNKIAEVFALTPQSYNEDIIANLDTDYVLEMFELVPRHLNIRTFKNFNVAKAASIQHLFDDIESYFPEVQVHIARLRQYCTTDNGYHHSNSNTTVVGSGSDEACQFKIQL